MAKTKVTPKRGSMLKARKNGCFREICYTPTLRVNTCALIISNLLGANHLGLSLTEESKGPQSYDWEKEDPNTRVEVPTGEKGRRRYRGSGD